ncbi:hypothetical protein KOW79_015694 [Hemibagrus wyckioides]|uniref:Uncharacterized protein n=1 Tax=Hemibagrus wyckioides TaxID=337641 RepID=A0A9D3NF50_9TELE|nr:hypothetical protein KOW79_015694 [Hemibagrus wyckioides]
MGLILCKNKQRKPSEEDRGSPASPGQEQLPVPCEDDSLPAEAMVIYEDKDFPMNSLNQPPHGENSKDDGRK